jgi:FtsH-binding integral membrane protein
MRSARLAVILDCCCVLVFVIIGRASHVQGESPAGIASTAWPFLTGLAGGWLATAALAGRAWRQPFRLWPAGVGAWLGAVALGMVFRVVSGQGIAPAFIGVALAFLGLFLLGWRLLARLPALRRSPASVRLGRGRRYSR